MRFRLHTPLRLATAAFVSMILTALAAGPYAGEARAEGIEVNVDQARLVRLDRPGAEIIIGNPSIADVAVQSNGLLVVTGKSTGVTNMIVLDAGNEIVLNEQISVAADKRLVVVQKGAARETHSCTPACRPVLVPGDAEGHFTPLAKQVQTKMGVAQAALEGAQSGAQ